MSIAKRAALAIRQRAKAEGTSIEAQYDKLNMERHAQYHWENGRSTPSGYALQQMALAGYDVMQILLGGDDD